MWAGGASIIGEDHIELNQPNQDNYLINQDNRIYAVFDGHGDKGHLISTYLRDNIPQTFNSSLNSTLAIDASFRSTFKIIDERICTSKDSESSGSTCIMAYINNNHLYVAGVGDCSALLIQAHTTNGHIDTTTLLDLHKVNNKQEHDRILQTGAQITGEYIVSRSDPHKVINMTRAFGDQDMRSAGVISIPDISVTKLRTNNQPNGNNNSAEPPTNHDATVKNFDTTNVTEHDTFLMLFSDGLDQVQSTQMIAKLTYKLLKDHVKDSKNGEPLQVDTICSNLLKQLEDNMYDIDGLGFKDDTTVIVVVLSGFT